eukprot:scaffold46050_cov67-Phaeocystis_antarctica.AAC.1
MSGLLAYFCSRRRVPHYTPGAFARCVPRRAPVGVHRHCRGLNAAVCARVGLIGVPIFHVYIHVPAALPVGWGGALGVRQPLQEWCSCRAPAAARPVGWGGALGVRQPLQEVVLLPRAGRRPASGLGRCSWCAPRCRAPVARGGRCTAAAALHALPQRRAASATRASLMEKAGLLSSAIEMPSATPAF